MRIRPPGHVNREFAAHLRLYAVLNYNSTINRQLYLYTIQIYHLSHRINGKLTVNHFIKLSLYETYKSWLKIVSKKSTIYIQHITEYVLQN